MRLRPRTWGKIAVGLIVIGGTAAVLWAVYRPSVDATVAPRPPAEPAVLHGSWARITFLTPRSGAPLRATIRCDGRRRTAGGFWRGDAAEACDALSSTRAALLSGPGCLLVSEQRLRLHAVGAFEGRPFDHRAQQLGCPDPRGWLAVNALVKPVHRPEQELDPADGSSGRA